MISVINYFSALIWLYGGIISNESHQNDCSCLIHARFPNTSSMDTSTLFVQLIQNHNPFIACKNAPKTNTLYTLAKIRSSIIPKTRSSTIRKSEVQQSHNQYPNSHSHIQQIHYE